MSELIEIMTLIGIIASSWLLGFMSYMLMEFIKPRKD